MNTKVKLFSVLALMIVGLIVSSGLVSAASVPVSIMEVSIDGEEVPAGEVLGGITRGETIKVKVKLIANATDEDVVVEATVRGIDHDRERAEDKTEPFTAKIGKTYYKTLSITLPDRMDVDEYALRIEVSNRRDEEVVYNAKLDIDQERNSVMIKDVVFSPENTVKAGRALLTSVRLKNMGADEEEDVKVKVSIPGLGISASDYIDEVDSEDSVTSEELYLRIPDCATAGEYAVDVAVEFDEGDEEVTESYVVTVVENEVCNIGTDAGKTVITVGSDAQDVVAGDSGVVYPITLSNGGTTAKTYTISAIGGDWADIQVSPSVVVLGAGETKLVYVTVAANKDATAGDKTFGVAIKSGDATLKEVTLRANVIEDGSAWDNVKKGLEVALVVLVVLLVIIGLIIGFNRLKGDDDEDVKEETYY